MAQNSVSEQLKIPADSEEYFRIPYSIAARSDGMTGAELKLYAFVYSRSRIKANANAVCRAAYEDMMKKLGIRSRSTLSRGIRRLESAELIARRKRFHTKSEYSVPDLPPDVPCFEMEDFFQTTSFEIPREGRARRLRDPEAFLLGLVATHTKNPGTKCFTGSIAQIAEMLGVCEKTVRLGLDVLTSAKLIRCRERYFRSAYSKVLHLYANKAIVRVMRHKRRKATGAPRELRSETEIAADQRAAREQFYARRRQFAERMAEQYRSILESDEQYVKLERDIRALDPKIVRADLAERQGAVNREGAQLRRRQTDLKLLLISRMAELNISPPQLDVNTYCRCKKCGDTGWLRNGKPCDCYIASKEDEED